MDESQTTDIKMPRRMAEATPSPDADALSGPSVDPAARSDSDAPPGAFGTGDPAGGQAALRRRR